MKSLRELYTVGRGPSSSHTIGPHARLLPLPQRNTRTLTGMRSRSSARSP